MASAPEFPAPHAIGFLSEALNIPYPEDKVFVDYIFVNNTRLTVQLKTRIFDKEPKTLAADASMMIREGTRVEEVTYSYEDVTVTEYIQIHIRRTGSPMGVVNLEAIPEDRAAFLIHKVIGFLQKVIGDRKVNFQELNIVIINNPLCDFYGRTVYTDSEQAHTIYLNTYGISEVHFASTICHEFGHALLPYSTNHNIVWLATTGFRMGLVWRHVQNYKDMRNFKF